MIKRFTAFLISIAMIVGFMPALVYAVENDSESGETEVEETTESTCNEPETDEEQNPVTEHEKDPENKDQQSGAVRAAKEPEIKTGSSDPDENDKLFNDYVNKLLYPDRYAARKATSFAGSRLSGPEKKLYDALKAKIARIADGTDKETRFVVTLDNTGLEDKYYTKDELGISSFQYTIPNGPTLLTAEAVHAFDGILRTKIDYQAVHYALLLDCPSELYWYDKTSGLGLLPRVRVSADENSGCYAGQLDVYFSVAEAYKGNTLPTEYEVDNRKIKTVKSSISNAKIVVENAKSKRDYEKLVYYRDYICSQVEYNHDAVETPTLYGNPWQLIWVFDKNKKTNVVCEGYSKAFKYLCDLSKFNNPNLTCLLVSGTLQGEGHMWNIMQFGDGKNYLVDVTNSDVGSKGFDFLFLAGFSSGSVEKGYTHSFESETPAGLKRYDLEFVYSESTLKAYSKEQLTLCGYNYTSSLDVHDTCGNLNWSVDHTGVLKISGEGVMTNFTPDSPAPWMAYGSYIETVVLSGNITSIGEYAFSGLPILKYVVIPGSVTSIGSYSFYGCPNLSKISGGTNIRTIGTYAFAKCSKLSSFSIKSSKLKKIGSFAFSGDSKLKTIYIQKTTKLTKSGVKGALKESSVKTVKVKKSKVKKYKKYFKKSNSGRKVKVKK